MISNSDITNDLQQNAADALIGCIFDDRYRLEEKLDSGGMGAVYRSTDLQNGEQVALKVIKQSLMSDKSNERNFLHEAQAVIMIQHPNVVSAKGLGITKDDYAYLVMELLEGQTLREVIAQDAPLDLTRAIVLMLQIADGIGAAHKIRILHRDLKPTNVFITRASNSPSKVKVLDFSLAKFFRPSIDANTLGFTTGRMRGTPRYMSPEQCEGNELNPASDVYSLGVIFYEMLTNTTPFSGDNAEEIALEHINKPPPSLRDFDLNIPTEIDEFVQRVLSKDPANRPCDANEFHHQLKALAERLHLLQVERLDNLSIEKLFEVGRASPSGSLVIDAETLRQLQVTLTKEDN
jgi:serine/threonine-protein kinase